MAIFLTGSTGYLGSYLVAGLFSGHPDRLNLLVRARTNEEARERLWQSLQLHFAFPEFLEHLNSRVRIFRGDLTSERFGLSDDDYHALVDSTDSILHCAASLNRKSEKQCLNVNLRGSLEVIQLARRAQNRHGLRRYSHVSTVAVAGKRQNEVVTEDAAIDWSRSDYDPYARTIKFCEHMVHQLLPDVQKTIFRPSIVLGDSRKPETNQFDMVRAFVFLAGLPMLPFRPTDKIDIVNVDFVAGAVADLHQKANPLHTIYHLSSGTAAETFVQLTDSLAKASGKRGPMFVPKFEKSTSKMVDALAGKAGKLGGLATLLKVFLPYLVWNTVFDNTRATTELGRKPVPFSEYSFGLLKFSRGNHFVYKYRDWPTDAAAAVSARQAGAGQDLGR